MAAVSPGSCASAGAAAPGATSAQRPGGRREQATRARPADAVPEPAAPATAITPPIAGAQRTVPGSTPAWPSLLATRASSREMQENRAEQTAEPALPANCRKTTGQKIRAASSSPTLRGFGGGSGVVRRQVIQIAGPRSAGRERRATGRARTRDPGTAEANLMILPGWSVLAAAGAPGCGTGCGGRPSSRTRLREYSQVTWCTAFRYAPENRGGARLLVGDIHLVGADEADPQHDLAMVTHPRRVPPGRQARGRLQGCRRNSCARRGHRGVPAARYPWRPCQELKPQHVLRKERAPRPERAAGPVTVTAGSARGRTGRGGSPGEYQTPPPVSPPAPVRPAAGAAGRRPARHRCPAASGPEERGAP